MRLLAFGDIHGCLTALDTLLGMVRPRDDDSLVLLGDYVDRGPDSRGVLERLLELRSAHRLVALCGNHEQMMLEARHNDDVCLSWLMYGGDRTLRSYACETAAGQLSDVPPEHWQFLESCVDWFETESHFFVHGSVAPDVPLNQQPISLLRWEIFSDPPPHMSGKVMVCGHTRQASGWPRNIGHAICIDTWVYGAGWLTCLDALSGHFWQANQRGECREAEIDDFLDPVVRPAE
jgi:serine/threonine protein phosphatase 1